MKLYSEHMQLIIGNFFKQNSFRYGLQILVPKDEVMNGTFRYQKFLIYHLLLNQETILWEFFHCRSN